MKLSEFIIGNKNCNGIYLGCLQSSIVCYLLSFIYSSYKLLFSFYDKFNFVAFIISFIGFTFCCYVFHIHFKKVLK